MPLFPTIRPFFLKGTGRVCPSHWLQRQTSYQSKISAFPWCQVFFFIGVLTAFIVHYIALSINSDIEARKRRKVALDGVIEVQSSEHFTPELQGLVDSTIKQIESVDRGLLKAETVALMQIVSSVCYFLSVGCFAIATIIAIVFLSAA